MPDIGFIGAGTVGTALAIKLNSRGYPVVAVSSRSRSSAGKLAARVKGCSVVGSGQEVADAAELVFITTSDDAIASVAARIKWHRGQGVVHCCGSESTDILAPASKAGAITGVFHPLQSFASVERALENIPGSTVTIEAEPPLLETLKDIAAALDAQWIELKAAARVVYHASAVFACNYLVTLEKLAADLWQTFGIPRQQAIRALLPLIRGTIHNIEAVGIPGCLTGPIARGDINTVSKHLDALKEAAPDLLAAYRELGLKTIPVALDKGKIDGRRAKELEAVLTGTTEKSRGDTGGR
ncbi:MAG: DUF2520 domain-containing protein [Dehalococcoidales bacterium]|nr:DUF2520 domain-containing protein [Dehalococcoidales bacterium]